MKLRVLSATLLALTLTAGIASAQTKPAGPAPTKPAASGNFDKTHAGYAQGWLFGGELVRTGESFDISAVVRGMQDAYAKKQPAFTEQQMSTAYSGLQTLLQKKAEEVRRKAFADNQAQSASFITKFKAEEGVVTLPSGLMYLVSKPGTGAKATANSQVEVAFRPVLAAVGYPLGQEEAPPPFKVADMNIAALKETLPLMQEGAVWVVVVPPGKLGGQNPQLAQQAVAFQVMLSSVK